jgi:uncharacterized protein YutE (UPF0331/DUF86 family)
LTLPKVCRSVALVKSNGVMAAKLAVLAETTRQLEALKDLTTSRLERDFFLKRGVERSLQICVEAVIDIAHRILSLRDQPPVPSGGKALEALEGLGILKDANAYKRMVQFRNLVVHRYEAVDNTILVDIVRNHLDEFRAFMAEIRRHANDSC